MRKYFGKSAAWLLLVLAIGIAPVPLCFADKPPAAQKAQPAAKPDTPQPKAAVEKPADPGSSLPQPEDVPVPINAEIIDEAGEALGKKIDAVGKGASVSIGKWVNARALGDITWLKLFVCFGLLLLVIALDRAVRRLLSMRIRRAPPREASRWGDLLLEALINPLSLFIRVYGIYWALSPIWAHFDEAGGANLVHRAAGKAADLGATVALFWFIYKLIHVVDSKARKWAATTDNSINDMLVPLVSKTVKGFVVVVGGIMAVQNMTGIEIGPLVASLGIGGLAIALAGKDSIANFLGSLTILLDKPFQVGERIVIDKHDGFVEGVGFRSTRLRTLTGNLVSIPNEKIINSTLENIGRRTYLRWHTNFGLTCATPPEKIERAVKIVEEILANHEGMSKDYPPRVYFNGLTDWSLNIAVYAWYFPGDFWKYQAWLQTTCIEIMRRFGEEGIEFAYPTQTVYQLDHEEPVKAPARAELNRGFSGHEED
ncbi:MAG: mechanosensitive ion channel family protein [Syntrophobacteraceae bacterium]